MTNEIVADLAAGTRSRAVAAGLDGYEFDALVETIPDPERWPDVLREAASRHLETGDRAAEAGRLETAATAYRTASVWLYFAQAWPTASADGYGASARAQWRAISLREPQARRLSGDSFRAVLRHPAQAGPTGPVVLLVSGLDGAKEEQLAVSDVLLSRGLSTVAIDGPAQGELTTVQPFSPDFSRVVTEVIETLQSLDGQWNPSSIGIWGSSLGGHYTVTALAREKRLAAGVVVSGFAKAGWEAMGPYVRSLATIRAGSEEAAARFADSLDVTAEVSSIEAPVFLVDGGQDPLVNGPMTGSWISGEVRDGTYRFIEQGDHNVANARWLWLDDAADWIAGHLRPAQ